MALALLLAAPASASSTLVVDKDGVQCPNATFQSIQAAVTAAAPGDTVLVCPDVYPESVVVDKAIAVKAQNPDRDPRRCFDPSPPAADPTRDAVVQSPAVAFNLLADNVTLDGFVIQTPVTGVRGGTGNSGFHVRRNLIPGATFGVSMGPPGPSPSVVELNCMRGGFGGVNLRTGTHNAKVLHNGFFQNDQGVIVRVGVADSDVLGNLSVEDGIFALVFPSTRLAIDGNTALRSQVPDVAAIAVGGTTDSEVNRNVILRGAGNGIGFAGPDQGVSANSNIEVAQNWVREMGKSGIRTTPSSLVDSLIAGNTSESNTLDGIRIESGTNTNNRVERNMLRGNGEHDCHDDTTGTGTAGTANFWIANDAFTANRPGLCPKRWR